MKNKKQSLVVEQDLFSEILDYRQSSGFDEDALSQQVDVQVVVKRQVYPSDQVREAAKEYFHGDSLAGDVWANKYAL